ncbi:hypothetical protein J6V85_00780 [Candidatus Saccharibacteria bacterium]|nr:hypothetical protein [Candidatus Saccharibacteria bacterium]
MAKRKNIRSSKGKIKSAKKIKAESVSIPVHKRPRGRPPKHKRWNELTGHYETHLVYPKDIVKAANERLRKLEKVSGLASSSPIYVAMERYKDDFPKTKGKIYQDNAQGLGVRFINKTRFEELSDDEKIYFIDRLKKFMLTESSLARGVKDIQKRSYESFMKSPSGRDTGLSFDEYSRFFKFYNDAIVPDTNDHYSYSDLSKALKFLRLDTIMRSRDLESVMKKIHDDNFKDIDRKYLNRI